jgi:hypothetical protein
METKELQILLADARCKLPIGSTWRHKKGGLYMIMGCGFDTEHARVNIHYFRIGGPGFDEKAERGIIFDRPLFMWTPDRFKKESLVDQQVSSSRNSD